MPASFKSESVRGGTRQAKHLPMLFSGHGLERLAGAFPSRR
jgi:hypothetical protein